MFSQLRSTGWSIMTVKKYELIAQAKKKPISLGIRPFHHYIGTFWYLVSKQLNDHPVIIHLERLLRCETDNIWKIHWKLKYSESQYCFANISAMEARIFMKFYMVVNYYLVNLSFKFYEDPCINAHIRVLNARAHVLSRVRAFTTCARLFIHGSAWNLKLKLTR